MVLSLLNLWLLRLKRLVHPERRPPSFAGRKSPRRPNRYQLLLELLEDRLTPNDWLGSSVLSGNPLASAPGLQGSSGSVLGGTGSSGTTNLMSQGGESGPVATTPTDGGTTGS